MENKIETIQAEYINPEFSERMIVPEHYIFRVRSGAIRWYGLALKEEMSEPKYAPGVTSILKDTMPTPWGLIRWREQNGPVYCDWFMESSAAYGTWLHSVYGSLMKGAEINFQYDALMVQLQVFLSTEGIEYQPVLRWVKSEGRNPMKDIYGFIQWFNDFKVKPIAIEYPLFIDGEHPYAGTIDLVCELTPKKGEKVLALVDFKTGFNVYESHAVQLRAYMDGWNQINPDCAVSELFNMTSKDYSIPLGKTALPYSMRRQTENKAAELWPDYLAIFHKKHGYYVEPSVKFSEGMINIKSKNILEGVADAE